MPKAGDRDEWLAQDDAHLLAACDVDTFRGPGPGGQKRNKTSSAVRLRHRSSGLSATARESRSQHVNKVRALRRLRLAIALEVRNEVPDGWTPPPLFGRYRTATGRIEISRRNPDYPRLIAVVLDALAASGGALAETAGRLGVGSAQLSKFVVSDEKLLARINRLRSERHLRPLAGPS